MLVNLKLYEKKKKKKKKKSKKPRLGKIYRVNLTGYTYVYAPNQKDALHEGKIGMLEELYTLLTGSDQNPLQDSYRLSVEVVEDPKDVPKHWLRWIPWSFYNFLQETITPEVMAEAGVKRRDVDQVTLKDLFKILKKK